MWALMFFFWAFPLSAPPLFVHVLFVLLDAPLILLPYHPAALGKSPCSQGGSHGKAGTNPPKMSRLGKGPATAPKPPMTDEEMMMNDDNLKWRQE